jgi:hypothetical protein
MNLFVKLSAVALFGITCAACSNGNAPAAAASAQVASAAPQPAASAIPMQAPAAGSSSETPAPPPLSNGPSLAVILQRPSFARAFADMDGASALPAWAKAGDSSEPSERVRVDDKTMWLSHVCQTADCHDGQLFLLTDPTQHAMQGLLVEDSGSVDDSMRKLTWLGKPDASAQAFLEARVATPD